MYVYTYIYTYILFRIIYYLQEERQETGIRIDVALDKDPPYHPRHLVQLLGFDRPFFLIERYTEA